jgi:hypothetical protein
VKKTIKIRSWDSPDIMTASRLTASVATFEGEIKVRIWELEFLKPGET